MRKYLQKMLEDVEQEGLSFGGCSVIMQLDKDERSLSNNVLTVYHYGTKILSCGPYDDIVLMVDGWSATDQTIINACFEYFSMPFKCRRHGETLTIQDVTA